MKRQFKYQVCQVQAGHVTYVNAHWQGNQALAGVSLEELINTCPVLWEYLNAVGRDGWNLVSVAILPAASQEPALPITQYILKREETISAR